MKLTWIVILRSNVLLFLLLNSCNNNDKSNSNINETGNNLNLTFVDSITKKKLSNFEFGVSTDKEELPISEILNKHKSILVKNNDIVIIKNLIKNREIFYGYFVKKGYKLNKFRIKKGLSNQVIGVIPEPSVIILKAIDRSVASEIDSINVVFEFRNGDTRAKEFYRFKKNDVDSNLEYFSKYIEYNQSVKLNIKVYNKGKFYDIERNIEYIPWTSTVINLI